uniref:Uncharacterized protein n=1 Tax=Anguilla anguilla TaxID=7936 RepID=A0A0E9Q295_ANGAN
MDVAHVINCIPNFNLFICIHVHIFSVFWSMEQNSLNKHYFAKSTSNMINKPTVF